MSRSDAAALRTLPTIYWHRDLPPLGAEPIGSHTIEATSGVVPGTLERRGHLWDRCHQELMAHASWRLGQELARLGGDYAHVLSEEIEPRHNDRTGETWLYGRFEYVLYRRSASGAAKAQEG